MSGTGSYIHGTDPSEQERLSALNCLTNQTFVEFLNVQAGTHVLEVGSGLGLLAAAVATSATDVEVIGLDRSWAQIAAAVKHPRELHWFGSPGFREWIRNVIGNVESARQILIASRGCSPERIDEAIAELMSLIENEQASSQFIWHRAVARS